MDSALPEQVIVKRKRKALLIVGALVLFLILATWTLRASLRSSLKRSAITISVVEKGTIENTINASGEVLPEFEEIITSPINASIQKVGLDAGSPVKADQSILRRKGVGLTIIREVLLNHGFNFSLRTIEPGNTEFSIYF